MEPQIKLILAIQQIDNLTNLLSGNEYQQFFYNHLITIKCELKRQLTNLQSAAKIKE
jgi:hypothetical protein